MNEFIEQFLVECRELMDQATEDLLALEAAPDDAERLASVFRGFHTLKGAAGIVDFHAMARALHAAEDTLSAARAGSIAVTPTLISDALTCLDQVGQWLDAMAPTGEPPAGADAQADAIVRRFGRLDHQKADVEGHLDWASTLRARHPTAEAAATALRYAPRPDALFQGTDPLARVAALPGLRALDVRPTAPWPPLENLDPYQCQVVVEALFDTPPEVIGAALADIAGEVSIEARPTTGSQRPGVGGALLQAQRNMLALPASEGLAGRIASAGKVAASVLRLTGDDTDADRVDGVTARAVAALDPSGLIEALDQLLRGDPLQRPDEGDYLEAITAEPATRTLRVDVERVDALVNLAGELLVAKTALAHAASRAEAGEDPKTLADILKAQHLHLDRLVDHLQHAVMNLRVLPMRHVFQRFPRLAREMVVSLGKPARLVTEGDATEADKAIVESLFEPLLHVLRNAFDHGIEAAEDRAAAGKRPSATVTLRARREGDYVIVEVEDDGRGLDIEKVRATALRRDLLAEDALAAMSDAEVADLIFAPGFSTAAEITSVSGRGVGMDAVRTAVERMGGRVQIASRPGQGTTVRFVLPFTIVRSRVMTVEAGGQLFGIPLEAVVETVRLERSAIAPLADARVFVHRRRTIPVIDLAEALGERGVAREGDAHIVIAMAGGRIGGLEVDRLGARMDVMLKPMEGLLSGAPGITGTTLLGDGRVLLVLDLQELLQ